MAIWFGGTAIVFALATLGWEQNQIRKQHRKMAAARAPLSAEEFLNQMEACGVSRDTAEYLRSWLSHAYRDGLKPAPDDHIYSDLHVLGDDSSELVTEYFERQRRSVPEDLEGSDLNDPTLAEIGLWLERWK